MTDTPTTRETQEWPEFALDLLEARYSLEGGAAVQVMLAERGFRVSQWAIRHKASRLDLADDMREFTPAADVARDAGVDTASVTRWVESHGYTRHCRTWGRALLLPLPAVRLYLTGNVPRAVRRPSGWWGVQRTAAHLDLSPPRVVAYANRGELIAVRLGRTLYYDPHAVRAYQEARVILAPRPNEVPLRLLARAAGLNVHRDMQALPRVTRHPAGQRPAHYTTTEHARAFLTAWGHREEMVETVLRRALMQGAKVSETDKEKKE